MRHLNGDVEKVRRLLKGGADVNFVHKGFTCLFVAAQENHTAVIELLLENKAEVDKDDLEAKGQRTRCILSLAIKVTWLR